MAFPILIVVLFTVLRKAATIEKHPEIKFESFESSHEPCLVGYIYASPLITKLGFAPNNAFYTNLVKSALGNKFKYSGFETENELNDWIRNRSAVEPVAAINFDILESVSPN